MLGPVLGTACLGVSTYALVMTREFWSWRDDPWRPEGDHRSSDDLDEALGAAWSLAARLHAASSAVAFAVFLYCGLILLFGR